MIGMWWGDLSTAICCMRLICFGSETQSTDPAPYLLITSSGLPTCCRNSGIGKPGSCESWAIFSSMVICFRRSFALGRAWADSVDVQSWKTSHKTIRNENSRERRCDGESDMDSFLLREQVAPRNTFVTWMIEAKRV